MIFLDNAATTLHKPKEVQEAVIAAFGQMGNSGSSIPLITIFSASVEFAVNTISLAFSA